MLVIFDTLNIYYIPQYLPIIEVLKSKGHRVKLICYSNKNDTDTFEQLFQQSEVDYYWVNEEQQAVDFYCKLKPDWIFFGSFSRYLKELPPGTKTAQLGHGIGSKPSYYQKSFTPMTVRFIEGKLRLNNIRKLYPLDNFVQVGFSKLDPLFNLQSIIENTIEFDLNPKKRTILYAPTFNPSSLECFPNDWPNDFSQYNILIKPHAFTYTREKYKKQRSKLKKWSEFANVYVVSEQDLSLLPFIKTADILLSEASSTLFEFAAVDKPVIVCNFFKLKWSYRGLFRYRFEKRFGKENILYKDIGLHVTHYKKLIDAIPQQLNDPQQYQDNRVRYTHDHVEPIDGLVSSRIVEYLENHSEVLIFGFS